ncbi:SsrA-binding protein SmpB [Candidatus Peribacteria bacterium]|nr:SsrA-binding protein SmpB [Candidatus Peribacteria bacterium]
MKVVASNRRARFDYDILETIEAGVMLSGPEVKSCRAGHVTLAGAYALLRDGRAYIRHMAIAPYRYAATDAGYQPSRERELLLKAEESLRLTASVDQKGCTLIPLEVRAGRFIKIALGVCRGRKKFDKRAAIKKRDTERRIREGREV